MRRGWWWKTVLRERRSRCRVMDISWFRPTMRKHCLISAAVGCLGAGCILCRCENVGKRCSRDRYAAEGNQKKSSWMIRVPTNSMTAGGYSATIEPQILYRFAIVD